MWLQKLSHIFTKIVFIALRTNLFYIVLVPFFITVCSLSLQSQELPKKNTSLLSVKQKDSIKLNSNISNKKEEIAKNKDSIKKKKSFLEGKIFYKSKHSVRLDNQKKLAILKDEAEVKYKDIELKSGIIVINYNKDEVYAGRLKDSTGKYIQYPVFKQGNNIVEPDSIRFNFKTKKALIWNSRTDQGEFKIKGEITKKENDSVFFIKNARFTTSKNLDDPEYYFLARKIKFVPKKKIVAGLTNMVIADVPTPIGLPYAFFPMTEQASSGIIMPTFGQNNAQGYSLQNGGYYFAISNNLDLALLGDYFTNGSYGLRAETNYAKRYKYRGNFNFRYENQINGERGLPGYGKSTLYNLQWSHSPDAKATPNSRFSASVNLGSSKYYQQSFNQLNTSNFLNNTLSSSISYGKTFNWTPQANLSLTASHSQNTNTKQINMTLPTLQIGLDRVFPFAAKSGTKKGIIKNLNFTYSLRGENRVQTTDSLFFKPAMFKNMQNGIQHNIPFSTNFKILKYFSITASSNFNETWYFKTTRKQYNTVLKKVEETDKSGFDSFRTYDFSSSMGTTIYGTFNFKKNGKIQSIRHTMRPNVGYSYAPSFEKYYDTYAIDGSGKMANYTRFEKGIFGGPSNRRNNNLSLSLNNVFEAKVRDKDSTKTAPKKIILINNLNFSSNYNIDADSLKWSPLRVSGGTNLLKDKLTINFGMTLNPYAINSKGNTIDKLNINNGGSLFRMTSANITLNYSINSNDLSSKRNPEQSNLNNSGLRNGGRADDLFGTSNDFSNRNQNPFDKKDNDDSNFKGFYQSVIPWDLNLAYSLTYSNNRRENTITQNSLMVSGNIDLTPRWKTGISTGYDFVQKGVTYTQLRFQRDLLSWRMDFQWNPFGDRASWYFFIGISSSMLSDIKWDKRSLPDRRL
ncbi:LPS-assembly protein LptD [Flavobacterium columnare]|uniref:LPS-assembly protein LptD n=1 Tax=Flavobacterium columnare TaxID=996 RepID=A0AAI8GAZ4_9FLAO|nr:putative LPS assembly protein LptD [Flavobacterium columnare]AMO19952.1 LPS-assembly protein LptD [Flavobacterium columnare]AUX17895.1 organic solvent tolerance protein OstA [Flavobacterium columnare]MEB3800822.1 LPS-assembly protein LptD [Flavobacterium columnare]QOG56962.1 LPS-assembly protein LptD [Flavobacterium columnare]QOG59686.1 LPS-assembly protein LptD [Flavobacterium columnare]